MVNKTEKIVIGADKKIKLDLDGKTLTSTASDYIIENYGELEIVDESSEQTGKITSTTNSTIYNAAKKYEEGDTEEKYTPEIIDVNLSGIKRFDGDNSEYGFEYNEDTKELKNTNNNHDDSLNTYAKGYIELDMTDYVGNYTLTVDAEISTYYLGYTAYGNGYVTISYKPDSIFNSSAYHYELIHVNDKDKATKTLNIAGGQKYYINLEYIKGDKSNVSCNDEFKITSIKLEKKLNGILTLSSGSIEINKAERSSIENAGIVYIKGGNIKGTGSKISGIKTLEGGSTYISGGTFNMTSSNSSKAVYAYGKASLTQITGGDLLAYYTCITGDCM